MARAHKRGDVWHTTDVIPDVLSCFRTLQQTKKSILAVVSLPQLAPRPTRSVCSEVDLRPCNGLVTGIPSKSKKIDWRKRSTIQESRSPSPGPTTATTIFSFLARYYCACYLEVTVTSVSFSSFTSHRGLFDTNQRLSRSRTM
jgi:hypothetical protein